MPDLWVPGAAGPSLEDFVKRLNRTVEQFTSRRGWEQALVEVQLHDGTRFAVHSIRPEPGFGFLTLCPYPEEEDQARPAEADGDACTPEELIVPVGSIVRITLSEPAEKRARFGFSVSDEA